MRLGRLPRGHRFQQPNGATRVQDAALALSRQRARRIFSADLADRDLVREAFDERECNHAMSAHCSDFQNILARQIIFSAKDAEGMLDGVRLQPGAATAFGRL